MIPSAVRSKLYIDHIVLTISNLEKTKAFYSKILGDPDYQTEHSIVYFISDTKLFLGLPNGTLPEGDKFDPNRIGLEHLAIGVSTLDDLKEIDRTLEETFIENSGIHIDKHSQKEKIWLDDPDGIRLEFFIR